MAEVVKRTTKKKKTAKRDDLNTSKSKKVKIEHLHHDDEDDEHEDLEEHKSADAIADWTKEELNELIDKITATLPEKDVVKYSTQMAKLDFEKVKFGRFDGDQCKAAWKHIITRIRRYRTMTELANDAKDWAKRPWSSFTKPKQKHPDLPKKPLTPFFRFFIEQREKIPKTMSTTETAKLVSKKFSELSDKKKKKYKDAYDNEMISYRKRLEEFVHAHPEEMKTVPKSKRVEGPEKAHTPFELFKLSKIKDKITAGLSKKEALEEIRKSWQVLEDKKRIKWIRKALSDQSRYQAELKEYIKVHPLFIPTAEKPLLTKAEKELKDRLDGKPERAPSSGYNLFSRKTLKTLEGSSKEKMKTIATLWKNLSDSERAKYNFEAKKASTKYMEEFEKYLSSLPEESRAQALLESNSKATKRKIQTDASGLVVGKKSAPKKPQAQTTNAEVKQEHDDEDDDDDEEDEEEEDEEDEADEDEDSEASD